MGNCSSELIIPKFKQFIFNTQMEVINKAKESLEDNFSECTEQKFYLRRKLDGYSCYYVCDMENMVFRGTLNFPPDINKNFLQVSFSGIVLSDTMERKLKRIESCVFNSFAVPIEFKKVDKFFYFKEDDIVSMHIRKLMYNRIKSKLYQSNDFSSEPDEEIITSTTPWFFRSIMPAMTHTNTTISSGPRATTITGPGGSIVSGPRGTVITGPSGSIVSGPNGTFISG